MAVTSLADYPPVLAIVGSRRYPSGREVWDYVKALPAGTVVVSGGKGIVDQTARSCCMIMSKPLPFIEFVPYRLGIDRYEVRRRESLPGIGQSCKSLPKVYPHFAAAAHARNDMIIRYCVENEGGVTVFVDRSQRTPGSLSMIEKSAKAGVLFEVFEAIGTRSVKAVSPNLDFSQFP